MSDEPNEQAPIMPRRVFATFSGDGYVAAIEAERDELRAQLATATERRAVAELERADALAERDEWKEKAVNGVGERLDYRDKWVAAAQDTDTWKRIADQDALALKNERKENAYLRQLAMDTGNERAQAVAEGAILARQLLDAQSDSLYDRAERHETHGYDEIAKELRAEAEALTVTDAAPLAAEHLRQDAEREALAADVWKAFNQLLRYACLDWGAGRSECQSGTFAHVKAINALRAASPLATQARAGGQDE